MTKCSLFIVFIAISLNAVNTAIRKDGICDTCLPTEKCLLFAKLNRQQQQTWLEKFQCPKPNKYNYGTPSGFADTAIGNFVCCSNHAWGIVNSKSGDEYEFSYNKPKISNNTFNGSKINSNQWLLNKYRNQNFNFSNNLNNPRHNNYSAYGNSISQFNQNSQQSFSQNRSSNNSFNNQRPNARTSPTNNYFNAYKTRPNPYFPTARGHENFFRSTTLNDQCKALSIFPPAPETECCGREASEADRISGSQNAPSSLQSTPNYNRAPNNNSILSSNVNFIRPSWTPKVVDAVSLKRSIANDKVNVTIEQRISGGKETELYQFPWTVLLKTTFNYGTDSAAFNCGGSLISSRYVLTAAHCVSEKGAIVKTVEVFLAEYDKRTFPTDCKISMGKRICVENIVMYAEHVILHPQYVGDTLRNDIALIRLRGNAPYTEYMRPICVSTFNVDNPDSFNLRLAVAGWGRNGRIKSDIKQSTTVYLVPQHACKTFYPNLSRQQLCAAGYSGEDTCSGDSGGPLMTVYRGKYYIVGIVSGKRADSPCGTSVPSLYTNVYYYLDWINRNIIN